MIYTNATVVTVNERREIIEDGGIAVDDATGRILAVAKTDALRKEFAATHDETNLNGKTVIPGLVSTHVHTAQSLLRGCADDLALIEWLCDRVWVLQGNFTREDGYAAARLSIAEMLKSGTTTFLEAMFADRYGFEGLVRAVEESGARGCLGKIVMDIGTYATRSGPSMHPGLVETREQSLLGALDMYEKYHNTANGRVHVWFGARTPGGVSTELYREMTSLAKERGMHITMHCAEVKQDREYMREQFDMSPMQYCQHVGLLGPQTVLVHMVHLDSNDIDALRDTGTHVSHNPSSNLKLASGFCRVPEMLEKGVNVSLGCDGAPCNNTYDLLREMKIAAVIHKAVVDDPLVVPAASVLEMATINGARALGLGDEIGSLEPGKKADFVVLDLNRLYCTPSTNPISTIVYTASGAEVDMVVVDGRVVVRDRELVTMNEQEIIDEGRKHAALVAERANFRNEPPWPVI